MSIAVSTATFARMGNSQRATKQWIASVAAYLNLSPSALAKNSGNAASTVTRYLNDTTGTVGISQRTLDRIAEYSGVPVLRMPDERGGLQEPDAIPFDQSEKASGWLKNAVDAIKAGRNHVFPYEMRGWSLDMSGILPGDVLVFDMQQRPKPGDVVCVQCIDFTSGEAETLVRIYQPPFVLSHSAKLGVQKPLTVDEDRVSVRGVMLASIRPRH